MKNIKKIQIVKVSFGKRVEIIEPVNLYNCKIGDDCFIGPFVEIQEDVVIGKNNRIQNTHLSAQRLKLKIIVSLVMG